MTNRLRLLIGFFATALAVAGVAIVAAPSANAAATVAWVGSAHAGAPGNSCLHPGYNSIQTAINAVANNGTVHVCGGRYVEQLQITRSVTIQGVNSPVITTPAVPANSSTACDTAIVGFQPNQDGISVCTSGNVHINNVSIDSVWPDGFCYDSMYGIFAGGGGNLFLNNDSITGAGPRTINGCQGGVAVQIGSTRTTPNEVSHLTMTNSSVTGYQKNGINIVGAGTTGRVSTTSVTGAGPTTAIAQNGVEVASGAVGTISGNTISGNECDVAVCGPDPLTDTQSTGILLFGASPKSVVATNTLITNDIGVYYLADTSGTTPKTATVIRGNKLNNNRFEGICLDQGYASINGNTYAGGNIGLSIIQYDGQTFPSIWVASNETMTLQTQAAVEIDSDNAGTDEPGKATLSNIATHGGAVVNHSTTIVIVAHNIH